MEQAVIICDQNDPALDNNRLNSGNPYIGLFTNGQIPTIFIPNSGNGNIPVCELDCVSSTCSEIDPVLCPYGCISSTYNGNIQTGCYNSEYFSDSLYQCCDPSTTC